MTLIHQETNQ